MKRALAVVVVAVGILALAQAFPPQVSGGSANDWTVAQHFDAGISTPIVSGNTPGVDDAAQILTFTVGTGANETTCYLSVAAFECDHTSSLGPFYQFVWNGESGDLSTSSVTSTATVADAFSSNTTVYSKVLAVDAGSPNPADCSVNKVGRTYRDATAHATYTCEPSGWLADSSSAASVTPPATKNVDDEEFDSEASTSEWTYPAYLADGGSPLDYTATFSTASMLRYSFTARPGWVFFQPTNAGTSLTAIEKTITAFTTNEVVYFQVNWSSRYTEPSVADDGNLLVQVGATSGGAFDNNNRCYLAIRDADVGPAQNIKTFCSVGGVADGPTSTAISGRAAQGQVAGFTYGAIQKVGNTMNFWIGSESGNWTFLQSKTITGIASLDRVRITVVNAGTTAPGNSVMGLNFIRFLPNTTNLP